MKPSRNSKVKLLSICKCDIPEDVKAGDEGRLEVEEVEEEPENIETEDNIENKSDNSEPTIPSSQKKILIWPWDPVGRK